MAKDKAKFNKNDPFGFAAAIGKRPSICYRVIAKLPNGKVGIGAWYASLEVIEQVKEEAVAQGCSIIRVEERDARELDPSEI